MGILPLKKRVNRDKFNFATKQRMFGVFAIDEILRYRGTRFPSSRTLCHPGMDWEWVTRVTVTREGNFTRSGIDEVDEAEIFEGAENRLTMNQTYTWEFQCKYQLQRYPFDTQVSKKPLHSLRSNNHQECKIKMTVGSLSMGTVKLLADKVRIDFFSSITCHCLTDCDVFTHIERAKKFLRSEG